MSVNSLSKLISYCDHRLLSKTSENLSANIFCLNWVKHVIIIMMLALRWTPADAAAIASGNSQNLPIVMLLNMSAGSQVEVELTQGERRQIAEALQCSSTGAPVQRPIVL